MKRLLMWPGILVIILAMSAIVMAENYTIDGNTVYWDSPGKGRISQTPHTLTGVSDKPVINFTAYQAATYDIAFGFDVSEAKPTTAWLWKNLSHTLDNYTESCSPYTGPNATEIPNCTTINVPYVSWFMDWKNIQSQFTPVVYAGKTWYLVKDVVFAENESKVIKVKMSVQSNTEGKYAIFAKPSHLTFAQAISAGSYILLDPWWNLDWLFKRQRDVSNPFGALTNFTMFVNVSTDVLISAGKLNGTCTDYRFLNGSEGAEFCGRLESNTCNTTGTAYWVRQPLIAAATNTTNFDYYGNAAAPALDTSCDFYTDTAKRIFNMGENAGATVIDSMNLGNATLTGADWVDGRFGKGLDCVSGNSDWVNLNTVTPVSLANDFTIEGWFYPKTVDAGTYIIYDQHGNDDGIILRNANGLLNIWAGTGAGGAFDCSNITQDAWHYVTVTHDGGTNSYVVYQNGVKECEITKAIGDSATNSARFCVYNHASSNFFNGIIDEWRLFNEVKSADWHYATWGGVTNVFGAEQDQASDSCTYSSGNWTIQGADGCNITSDVNMGLNEIIFNGTGTVNINASITNWTLGRAIDGAFVSVNGDGMIITLQGMGG